MPPPLVARFMGSDSLYLIRVFPKGDVWGPRFFHRFVRDLRSVDPDATGDPVTLSVFTRAFRDACIKGAIYAVLAVIVFLLITLRSLTSTAAALMPFVLGALWTFGLMRLIGIELTWPTASSCRSSSARVSIRHHHHTAVERKPRPGPFGPALDYGHGRRTGRSHYDRRFREPYHIEPPGHTQPGAADHDR